MGHVRRRKLEGGRTAYLARYRGPDGRERSKQFPRRADAERFLAVAEVAQAEGSWVDPSKGRMRLRDWIFRFQEAERQALRPSTLARDQIYVRTQILPAFGDVPLSRIEHLDVQEWINKLSANFAPTTVHKCHQILRKTLAGAVRSRLLARNPCDGIQLPRVHVEEMRFIGPPEIARLTDAIDQRYRAFVLLGAYCGLRLGEMAGLRWQRVDLGRGCVEVTEISVEINGTVSFGPPKTKAGRRTVALPDVVGESLRATRPAHAQADDLVFRAPAGGPIRHRLFRRRFWYPAVERADLEGFRIHDLRHTAVALWIAAGASPTEVAQRAGHTSVVTVLDRYGHLLPATVDAVTQKLNQIASTMETLATDRLDRDGAGDELTRQPADLVEAGHADLHRAATRATRGRPRGCTGRGARS
jgi:integrase